MNTTHLLKLPVNNTRILFIFRDMIEYVKVKSAFSKSEKGIKKSKSKQKMSKPKKVKRLDKKSKKVKN